MDAEAGRGETIHRRGLVCALADVPPQVLLEPFTYLCSVPGKEVRSHLIDAFNVWLNVPEEELDVIRQIVRMLHNASLL